MDFLLIFRYIVKMAIKKVKIIFRRYPSEKFKALINLDAFFNSEYRIYSGLYLGDSVVERIANQDIDRRTLGQMVTDELLPSFQTAVISHSAYHLLIYYELLTAFEVTRHSPQIVILPVNIRSFSPQWDFQPRWQYQEEISSLKRYRKSRARVIDPIYRDRYVVPEYIVRKFESTKVNYPESQLNTVGQFLDVIAGVPGNEHERIYRKKQIFVFNYMHPLVDNHRKLIKLTEIVEFLNKMKIKVFVYLTPINIESGGNYVGESFLKQVKANALMIDKILAPYVDNINVSYSNWIDIFPANLFFYKDLATEHLNQGGRHKLSKLISHEVNALLNCNNKEKVGE